MGHTQENFYPSQRFLAEAAHVSKLESSKSKNFDQEYQEFLRYKCENQYQGQSFSIPSVNSMHLSISGGYGFLIQVS